MATCYNCIHTYPCKQDRFFGLDEVENKCAYFKNKADFVEVVRCGNCLNRIKGTYPKCQGRKPDEFCSNGIRKEGERWQ